MHSQLKESGNSEPMQTCLSFMISTTRHDCEVWRYMLCTALKKEVQLFVSYLLGLRRGLIGLQNKCFGPFTCSPVCLDSFTKVQSEVQSHFRHWTMRGENNGRCGV